jgi:hypothetical protein
LICFVLFLSFLVAQCVFMRVFIQNFHNLKRYNAGKEV